MKVTKKKLNEGSPHEATIWRNAFNRLHREDGPAVIYKDGRKSWYLDGHPCFGEEHYKQEMYKRNLKKLNVHN